MPRNPNNPKNMATPKTTASEIKMLDLGNLTRHGQSVHLISSDAQWDELLQVLEKAGYRPRFQATQNLPAPTAKVRTAGAIG